MNNHCTLWPEGWWSACCKGHDDAYLEQAGRALADSDLLACVATSAPTPVLAFASAVVGLVMYVGVRAFGSRFYRKAAPPL